MENIIVYLDDAAYAQQQLAPMQGDAAPENRGAGTRWVRVACPPHMTRRIGKWVSHSARESWRGQRLTLEVLWPDEPPAAAAGIDPGDRVDLERSIARLPDGCRQVLVLHDIEGFTHEEIAALLGIEPGTSKSQLFHARRRLRASLGPGTRLERKENR